ncbi:hypothetical protein KZO25_02615 [Halomonas sp. ANAO-440]|uniref:hypothetical protein n=1 Tax=Halomonas sp. ANAO-440 TaxID=2861360 RepID=UPI001CAA5408|nr:hypothetical protein [Halomonas sp. ANAO-440]MBZ0329208.1 hypothetical protein [Halomonas sp. ANAO-440]
MSRIPTPDVQVAHACPPGHVKATSAERRSNVASAAACYYYHTYGFDIVSQIRLPELTEIAPCESPDIEIVTGEVETTLRSGRRVNHWLQIGDQHCHMWVDGIGRYLIEGGQRIVVDRRVVGEQTAPPAPSDIRVFLLGTAFGVLAHQRGWLPLHVSAIKAPGGIWAFTGESGAGKSTLSAWLHHHYHFPLVTDDVAIIKPGEAEPLLHAGPRKVKLWKETLTALQLDMSDAQRDLTRIDKYHLALISDHGLVKAEPLTALVVLERASAGEQAQLSEITGAEALYQIVESLYRAELGRSYHSPEAMIRECKALADRIKVYRYRRPWALQNMAHSLEPLLQQLGL